MYIQLNKVLVLIALFSFIFVSYTSEANSVSKGLEDIQEKAKDYLSSFSVRETMENMSPSTIIGLCIVTVILVVVFRGLIFFMIIFGVLIIMFGSTEKVIDSLKGKFNSEDIKLQSDNEKKR
ncbi:MAG: hypothetical protein ACR5KV_03955 [Wolbachia sp.]